MRSRLNMRIFVVYYSLFGHIHQMAHAISEGVKEAGYEAELYRVPETLSDEILHKMGAFPFQDEFRKLPIITPSELAQADAVLFGTPTRGIW